MHLDRDVRQAAQRRQTLLVNSWRLQMFGDDRRDQGTVARPDPPQMQIGHPVAVQL
jgi:hypothetical protein